MARSAFFSLGGVVVGVAFGHGDVVAGVQTHEVVHEIVGGKFEGRLRFGACGGGTTS